MSRRMRSAGVSASCHTVVPHRGTIRRTSGTVSGPGPADHSGHSCSPPPGPRPEPVPRGSKSESVPRGSKSETVLWGIEPEDGRICHCTTRAGENDCWGRYIDMCLYSPNSTSCAFMQLPTYIHMCQPESSWLSVPRVKSYAHDKGAC